MTIHYDPTPVSAPIYILADDHSAPTISRESIGSSEGIYRAVFKRALDVILVCLSAPISVLTVAVLALAAAYDGGSPLYSQDRVGLDGRIYRMWKLRSMVVDADARLAAYLAADDAARLEWDTTQKLKADPRITRFGTVLRKYSLDELPQLWNVLIGDMSLVGPRPMMPSQQDIYPGTAYYKMRPGITGMWQVSRRNESSFAERAHFDNDYDRSLSLKTDITLLARTVRVVLGATGY